MNPTSCPFRRKGRGRGFDSRLCLFFFRGHLCVGRLVPIDTKIFDCIVSGHCVKLDDILGHRPCWHGCDHRSLPSLSCRCARLGRMHRTRLTRVLAAWVNTSVKCWRFLWRCTRLVVARGGNESWGDTPCHSIAMKANNQLWSLMVFLLLGEVGR